jgi:hypothetical protein
VVFIGHDCLYDDPQRQASCRTIIVLPARLINIEKSGRNCSSRFAAVVNSCSSRPNLSISALYLIESGRYVMARAVGVPARGEDRSRDSLLLLQRLSKEPLSTAKATVWLLPQDPPQSI